MYFLLDYYQKMMYICSIKIINEVIPWLLSGFLESLLQVNNNKIYNMNKNDFKSSNDQIGMVVGECVGTVVTILLTEAIRTWVGGRRNKQSL